MYGLKEQNDFRNRNEVFSNFSYYLYLFSTHVKYPIFFACGEDFAKCLVLSITGELTILVTVLRVIIGLFVNFGVDGLKRFKTGLFEYLISSS